MNQTEVLLRIIELAKVGGAVSPQKALANLAVVISHLDMYSDTYEADAVALMAVGATIWDLTSGPDGAHDPDYVPTVYRP